MKLSCTEIPPDETNKTTTTDVYVSKGPPTKFLDFLIRDWF